MVTRNRKEFMRNKTDNWKWTRDMRSFVVVNPFKESENERI